MNEIRFCDWCGAAIGEGIQVCDTAVTGYYRGMISRFCSDRCLMIQTERMAAPRFLVIGQADAAPQDGAGTQAAHGRCARSG